MSDDLVKRLREGVIEHRKRLMMQAADRIEALEARAEKAEAERDALREALRSIENAPRHAKLSDHELVDWMQAAARAALNRETDT